jgi:hypothetical protein
MCGGAQAGADPGATAPAPAPHGADPRLICAVFGGVNGTHEFLTWLTARHGGYTTQWE